MCHKKENGVVWSSGVWSCGVVELWSCGVVESGEVEIVTGRLIKGYEFKPGSEAARTCCTSSTGA